LYAVTVPTTGTELPQTSAVGTGIPTALVDALQLCSVTDGGMLDIVGAPSATVTSTDVQV
jgi:hypothetical protein